MEFRLQSVCVKIHFNSLYVFDFTEALRGHEITCVGIYIFLCSFERLFAVLAGAITSQYI
jgi:hypothetical protein